MKSAETCSCSLCNKFYTYLYHHIVVLVHTLQSSLIINTAGMTNRTTLGVLWLYGRKAHVWRGNVQLPRWQFYQEFIKRCSFVVHQAALASPTHSSEDVLFDKISFSTSLTKIKQTIPEFKKALITATSDVQQVGGYCHWLRPSRHHRYFCASIAVFSSNSPHSVANHHETVVNTVHWHRATLQPKFNVQYLMSFHETDRPISVQKKIYRMFCKQSVLDIMYLHDSSFSKRDILDLSQDWKLRNVAQYRTSLLVKHVSQLA